MLFLLRNFSASMSKGINSEFANAMSSRVAGIGFSINGYGYVTVGGSSILSANDNSTWKFYPGIDEDDNNDY